MDQTAVTRRAATGYIDRLTNRDWPGLAALLAGDVVYEMPQTGERVTGRDAFVRFNIEYPGDWRLHPRRILADGHSAAVWLDVRAGGGQQDACVWLDVADDGLIIRIVDYWPEAYDPPPGREHLVQRSTT